MNDLVLNCVNSWINSTTKGFEIISKQLRDQNRFNRRAVVGSLIVGAYLLVQHSKVKKLSNEVQELKRTRGE